MSHITIRHHDDDVGGRHHATPDPPTTFPTLPNDVLRAIFRHVDFISQVQFAFSHPSIFLQSRVVLLPSHMDALFNYTTPDTILFELITILCDQSSYHAVLLTVSDGPPTNRSWACSVA
jgi:hypothetical protein